ncbi:MAG: MotE family protein [bacterium]
MADETKQVESQGQEGAKGILGMGSRIPLDAIIIVVAPFLLFVFLFLHVMGFLPPQPLRVKVIMPETEASEVQSLGSEDQSDKQGQPGGSMTGPAAEPSQQSQIDVKAEPKLGESKVNENEPADALSAGLESALGTGKAEGSSSTEDEAHFKQIAKVYEQMKPASVAAIMSTMSDSEVTEILRRMKARDAAKILALIEPQRAARLSKMMTE